MEEAMTNPNYEFQDSCRWVTLAYSKILSRKWQAIERQEQQQNVCKSDTCWVSEEEGWADLPKGRKHVRCVDSNT